MNDLEVLDEPNDVAGVKRASEETEAEGAPDPKFAKFDDGVCLCVSMKERVCEYLACVTRSSRIHTVENSFIHTSYTLFLHIFSFSPSYPNSTAYCIMLHAAGSSVDAVHACSRSA
jgi:hypothetical protein